MNDVAFNTVRRGYDPMQVDDTLRRLQKAHAVALEESASKSIELNRMISELATAQAQASELRARVEDLTGDVAALESSRTAPITYSELGPRIANILTLAEEEADDLRGKATTEAQTRLSEAAAEAERQRAAADAYAADTRSRADAEALRTVELARREADDVMDHAERESSARRREAEAVHEDQRAQSAAAAAEFEKTLAARREKSATEFEAQMANHDRALKAASDKITAAEDEAATLLRDSRAAAEAERERATAEAQQLLDNARIHAERVRRDSERELTALASRRDSITEQLTNVRQMLATLSGGTALAHLTEAAQADTAPEADSGTGVASDGEGGEASGDGEGAPELAALEQE